MTPLDPSAAGRIRLSLPGGLTFQMSRARLAYKASLLALMVSVSAVGALQAQAAPAASAQAAAR